MNLKSLISHIFILKPHLSAHGFRLAFHVFTFILATFYSFSDSSFLHPDVLVFLYTLIGMMFLLDTLVFFCLKRISQVVWVFIYAIDALFIALLLYKLELHLPFFIGLWMVFIVLSSLQLAYGASLFQGIWSAFLWGMVVRYSHHLKDLTPSLVISNLVLLLVFSFIMSVIAYYFRFNNTLYSFHKMKFDRLLKSSKKIMEGYLSRIDTELLRDYAEFPDREKTMTYASKILIEALNEMDQNQVAHNIRFKCEFNSLQKIVVDAYRFKKVLIGLILYMAFHSTKDKEEEVEPIHYKIETQDSDKYIMIQIIQQNLVSNKGHLEPLRQKAKKAFKGISFLEKTLDAHESYLKLEEDKEEVRILIFIPLKEEEPLQWKKVS